MTPPEVTARNLPHSVYRIYAHDGTLLYIGCARDVEHRIYMHERCAFSNEASHQIWQAGGIARWEAKEYPNRPAALVAERAAIHIEAPLCNKQSNPKRWRKVPGGYEKVGHWQLPERPKCEATPGPSINEILEGLAS